MIDYQEIIDNLTEDKVKEILNKLEIPFEDRGSYLLMPTYCHNHKSEDASHKLYYYKNNKIFMCYTECQAMSIFRFLKNYYEAQDIEFDWYRDIYSVIMEGAQPEGFTTPQYRSLRNNYNARKNVELPTYPSGVLDCFVKKYLPEWLADGISREAMDKYNIRYSISQNKIIIPHYAAASGLLIGIRGRALNQYEIEQYGKYAPVWIEGKCYSHPLGMNLYGLWENKENIRRNGVVYVAEGEKSVLQMESFHIPNCCVATCGSSGLNKFQLNLLLQLGMIKEIILCYDKEEESPNHKYFDKLYENCKKYHHYTNMSFVYDHDNLLKMKDSPFDRGEDTFLQLLQRRVCVR